MGRQVRVGMTVRSKDGARVGKVIRCLDDAFVVEKGFFFRKDYVVPYDQASVEGDVVALSRPASSLREAKDAGALETRRTVRASGIGTELGTYATGESGVRIDEGERGRGTTHAHGTGEEARGSTSAREERRAGERGDPGSVKEPEE